MVDAVCVGGGGRAGEREVPVVEVVGDGVGVEMGGWGGGEFGCFFHQAAG